MPSSGETGPRLEIANEVPLVGREKEREVLSASLLEARAGRGSTWIVEGPGGIGKTTLVRWLQEAAERSGFGTFWGFGLKEVSTPFFPFQQMFRSLATPSSPTRHTRLPSPLPSVVIFEEERPAAVFESACGLARERPTLVIAREREDQVREQWKDLALDVSFLRLTRGGGAGSLTPGDVEAIGHRAREHLDRSTGRLVVLTGVEYLVSQSGFPAVLRLLQFLRDSAEEREGHVFLSLNPQSLEPRQAPLLAAEGEVVRREEPSRRVTGPVPESATATMTRYIETLEREAPRRPLLLFVDDLQWADPASLRTFQFLARNIRSLPVMIVATYRTDDIRAPDEQKERSLKEVLAAAEQEGTLHRLSLHGLEAREALELAHELFGHVVDARPGDPGFAELMQRSEGNPYFLKETLRRLAEEGFVQKVGDHVALRWKTDPSATESRGPQIPPTLQRLVQRRLERLSEAEREVLDWAVVAGSMFDLAPLEGVIAPGPVPLPMVIDALEHREHLIEPAALGHWTFGHPLVWEVAQMSMTPEDRSRRAFRLGEWWATRRPDEVPTVARLFHEAGRPSPGIEWTQRAIQLAIRSYDLESVERYSTWNQELLERLGAGAERRVQGGLEVVDQLCTYFGNTAEAVRMLRSLSTLAPSEELSRVVQAYLALNLAQAAPKEAREILTRLQGLPEPSGTYAATIRGILGLATLITMAARGQSTDFATGEAIARSMGDALPPWVRIRATYWVGVALARGGFPERARERLRAAWQIAECSANPLFLGYCWSLEAFLAETGGEVLEHRRTATAALEVARTTGSPVYLCIALVNLGNGLILQGDLSAADDVLTDLRKQAERFRVERGLGISVPHLEGSLALRRGRPSDAIRLLEASRQYMVAHGDVEQLPEIQISLAEARLALGEVAQARELLERVLHRAEPLDSYTAPLPFLLEGRILGIAGEARRAHECFERGQEVADRPPNLFNEALALNHLGAWEEAFGDARRAAPLRAQAKELFDRCGILPEAWARSFPPPLALRPASDRAGSEPQRAPP